MNFVNFCSKWFFLAYRTMDMGDGLHVFLFCYSNKKLLTKQSNYKSHPTIRGPIVVTTRATISCLVRGFQEINIAVREINPNARLIFATDGYVYLYC